MPDQLWMPKLVWQDLFWQTLVGSVDQFCINYSWPTNFSKNTTMLFINLKYQFICNHMSDRLVNSFTVAHFHFDCYWMRNNNYEQVCRLIYWQFVCDNMICKYILATLQWILKLEKKVCQQTVLIFFSVWNHYVSPYCVVPTNYFSNLMYNDPIKILVFNELLFCAVETTNLSKKCLC